MEQGSWNLKNRPVSIFPSADQPGNFPAAADMSDLIGRRNETEIRSPLA